jgi:hypothetical protein
MASDRLPVKKQWWDQVQVAPDVKRITVFNKGKPHGLIDVIAFGGQTLPNSKTGFILE